MPTDFRDGHTFPRSGREQFEGFMWLARVFDKARASANGTIHDYIYPCPIDKGMFEHWGITPSEFDRAVAEHRDDRAILAWAQSVIPPDAAQAANRWLIAEKTENLDRQDGEERGSPV
ncbi:MAG TPA: DUF5069 domain-containing protein [Candidatus Baltobacteraceae bacterium]|jgi:hypothetical protein|nr:DUF5069 domain-containing protein [Candidatus Baltobacteraceae bacterium]